VDAELPMDAALANIVKTRTTAAPKKEIQIKPKR
jgi:hypothetical protein